MLGRGSVALAVPLAVLLAVLLAAPMRAQDTAAASQAQAVAAVDSVMRASMSRERLPGATLVVVKDGRVIMERGYGFADLEAQRPVDPQRTLFGVSSISKVFTATAVLQLAAAGRVSLYDDVSRYLRHVRVPADFAQPITLAHLLTHSAGLDERAIGIAARRAEDAVPLAEYLATHLPPRVSPPGLTASYSNHGFALAGLVVEEVTGIPFSRYADTRVLAPLGMSRSSFAQPLPPSLERDRAVAYERRDGRLVRLPRIYFNDAPASALFVTGRDMERFLLAHLSEGASRDSVAARLSLPGGWLDSMRVRRSGHDARLPGLTFGFRERYDSGHRGLDHGGDWQDYSSQLYLLPDARLGLFVAFNAGEGYEAAEEVWRTAVQRLVPPRTGTTAARDGIGEARETALAAFAGTYRVNRHSRSTIAKLGILTGDVAERSVSVEGGRLRALRTTLLPEGRLLFRRADNGELVAFRRDSSGRVSHLFTENGPYAAFDRVAWYDSTTLHLVALLGSLVTLAVVPVALAVRRRRGGRDESDEVSPGARRLALAVSIVALGSLFALVALLASSDVWEFQYGVPMAVRAVLWAMSLLPVLVAAQGYRLAVALRRTRWGRRERTLLTIHTVAAIVLVLWLAYWRVLLPGA
jgi:CubicO group peptidase (beta-lactamase class C family)